VPSAIIITYYEQESEDEEAYVTSLLADDVMVSAPTKMAINSVKRGVIVAVCKCQCEIMCRQRQRLHHIGVVKILPSRRFVRILPALKASVCLSVYLSVCLPHKKKLKTTNSKLT